MLVKSGVARPQMENEIPPDALPLTAPVGPTGKLGETPAPASPPRPAALPKRFHGSVALDATRVGRDAGKIAEEVIAHLSGLVGSNVTVTLEIYAEIPAGAPDGVVRTVTENARTLKFSEGSGFERE